MIVGLVSITPAAGFVTGLGAILIGLIASAVVWLSWNKLGKLRIFRKVDDAMGVIHTHGVAGLMGGLLVGLFADPAMAVYLNKDGSTAVSFAGLFHGHPKQLALQAGAAGTIIVWDVLMTFVILRVIGLFVKLRAPEEVLELGDIAVHDEEAYPVEGAIAAASLEPATVGAAAPAVESVPEPEPAPDPGGS
jgi:Amt family ammonium transporter